MTSGGSTRLAAHWIPGSNRGQDHDYMKRSQFRVIKIVSTDPARVREALQYATSEVIIRRHDISEEQTAMASDPVGTGRRHAAFWRSQFAPGGRLAGLPLDRILVEGINEPSLHNAAEEQIALDYNLAFLEDLRSYGIRGLALNASSGWVRNTDTATVKNTRPIWDIFRPLESAILAGKHGLGLHEYWRDDPDEGWFTDNQGYKWGWNAHRHWACPLRVPIYIGECGMSKEINGKPAPGQSAGWVGNISPATYAEQVWRYVKALHPNVVAACLFTTDMESEDWRMDDTLQAHDELVKRRTSYVF
ncbi:MAG TPA: cellulase family glycosylhydrolase, partial [Anaerolineae bacterium]|nr:cellulase family glycosylhydrolase [Anaerolineae bacterium]